MLACWRCVLLLLALGLLQCGGTVSPDPVAADTNRTVASQAVTSAQRDPQAPLPILPARLADLNYPVSQPLP